MNTKQEKQQEEKSYANTKQQKNIGFYAIVILLILIIAVSSGIGIFAWARYQTLSSEAATATVAKWNFDLKLKEGKEGATETTGPIDLASTQFTHVADGRIAPGTSGKFYVIIDTTGTEVDVQYTVNIQLQNCPRNIRFYRGEDNNGELLSEGGVDNTSRSLEFSKYLAVKKVNGENTVNENGKHQEAIYWEWPYEGTIEGSAEKYDEWDTEDSKLGTTTITISTTGTEMIGEPKKVGTLQVGDYVDIGTQLLNDDELMYNEGGNRAEWRVAKVDEARGKVTLILSDFLPTAKITNVADMGMTLNSNGYTLGWSSGSSSTAVTSLTTSSNWTNLLTGSKLAGKSGVTIKGALTKDEVPSTTAERKANQLFVSHDTTFSNCSGYWLASATGSDDVWRVRCNGDLYTYDCHDSNLYGARPAVILDSDIFVENIGTNAYSVK